MKARHWAVDVSSLSVVPDREQRGWFGWERWKVMLQRSVVCVCVCVFARVGVCVSGRAHARRGLDLWCGGCVWGCVWVSR